MSPRQHVIAAPLLTAEAFRPYGEVITGRRGGGQFDANPYDPETSPTEPRLVLTNGQPRLWIMHLRDRGVCFSNMARHRRVTQCLGALGGREWLMGFARPADLADDAAQPRLEDVVAFRIPGDCVIKLHLGTWHAGPHFFGDECLFFNLENLDTNRRDFQAADLPVEVRMEP